MTKLETFNKTQLKKESLDIRPGDTIKVHQKIKETVKKGKSKEEKERIQVFEGLVLARKHGKGVSATITVRRVIAGVGVEKIFPIHSPNIEKIEIVKRSKVRRAKLYYLREAKGKKARLKRKEFAEIISEEPELKKEEPKKDTKIEAKERPAPKETPANKEVKTEEESKI